MERWDVAMTLSVLRCHPGFVARSAKKPEADGIRGPLHRDPNISHNFLSERRPHHNIEALVDLPDVQPLRGKSTVSEILRAW